MSSPNQLSEAVDRPILPVDAFEVTDEVVASQPISPVLGLEVLVEPLGVIEEPQTQAKQLPKKKTASKKSSQNESCEPGASEDIIKIYLTEIGEYPLLTKDDEVRLAKQRDLGLEAQKRLDAVRGPVSAAKRRGDLRLAAEGNAASETFICANLRLVVSIAKKYQSSGMPLPDLIQEGNSGLEHAVVKFEWQKGFKFSTYATWWIRQSIERGIANKNNLIRRPVHASEDLTRLGKAEVSLLNAHIETTASALAQKLGWSIDKVIKVRQDRQVTSIVSLDEPISDDLGSSTLGDMIGDTKSNEGYLQVEADLGLKEALTEAMYCLDGRERAIITELFGLESGTPKSLRDTGQQFNVTAEAVRRTKIRAFDKLRNSSVGLHELVRYLDDK